MSRLGKTPIPIPSGVNCTVNGRSMEIKGPKGTRSFEWPEGITIDVEGDAIVVGYTERPGLPPPMHGLYRALLNNSVVGVHVGFEKRLTLIGVGYRAALKGTQLELQLGFSKPRYIDVPQGIEVQIEKGTALSIKGIDKGVVGQFAANIRSMRPPEPYKGKGVRYEDEYVRKKAGKAAKG